MLEDLVGALFLALGVVLLVIFIVMMITVIVITGAFIEWITKN